MTAESVRPDRSPAERIEQLERALRFYADPDTYRRYDDVEETWPPEINEDRGKLARAALAASAVSEPEPRSGWVEHICAHSHRWRSEDKSKHCPVCGTSTFKAAVSEGPVEASVADSANTAETRGAGEA